MADRTRAAARRRAARRRAAAAGLAAAAALAVTACGDSPITAARLNASLAPTFTRLYAQQQEDLGNAVDPAAYSTASCARAGGGSTGAGDDWVCAVTIYRTAAKPVIASVELNVKTDGCYVADAPAAAVGPLQLPRATGGDVANPLAEFDGCFDLS